MAPHYFIAVGAGPPWDGRADNPNCWVVAWNRNADRPGPSRGPGAAGSTRSGCGTPGRAASLAGAWDSSGRHTRRSPPDSTGGSCTASRRSSRGRRSRDRPSGGRSTAAHIPPWHSSARIPTTAPDRPAIGEFSWKYSWPPRSPADRLSKGQKHPDGEIATFVPGVAQRVSRCGALRSHFRGETRRLGEGTRDVTPSGCHPDPERSRRGGGGTQRMPPPPRASSPRGDNPERPSVALGERECHVAATAARVVLPAPACDHAVLARVQHVGG